MAKMMPAFFQDSTPPGERAVFNYLSSGPADWVILHSLDVAPWNHNVRTEIDFVILMPSLGIVCIEVKSQKEINFDGSQWYPNSIKYSPFKQALDGSKTLHRRLKNISSEFRKIPVLHLCIFPFSFFDVRSKISIQPWELIEKTTFQNYRNGIDFCKDIEKLIRKAIDNDPSIPTLGSQIDPSLIDNFIQICLPVQKFNPSKEQELKSREIEMNKLLREQQKPILGLVQTNPRLLVKGPAGTGKTFMAMEVAIRKATEGKRVALLCFNKIIGDWMKDTIEKQIGRRPNLVIGRVFQVLTELTQVDIPPEATTEFWDEELPELLEEKFTDPEFKERSSFDYLVIDEVQDIIVRESIWNLLNSLLKDGVLGTFFLAGDIELQSLYKPSNIIQATENLQKASSPVVIELNENCRNYKIIGSTAISLSGARRDMYSSYVRGFGSIDSFDITFYKDDSEQLKILVNIIKYYISQGYKQNEITILSFKSLKKSIVNQLSSDVPIVEPLSKKAGVFASSIHAFKGMESKVVILCDVNMSGYSKNRDLFYIALTRATEAIRVVCSETSKKILDKWLEEIQL